MWSLGWKNKWRRHDLLPYRPQAGHFGVLPFFVPAPGFLLRLVQVFLLEVLSAMGGCGTRRTDGLIGSNGMRRVGCKTPSSSWIRVVRCLMVPPHSLKPVNTCEDAQQRGCGRTWCVRDGRRFLLSGELMQNPEQSAHRGSSFALTERGVFGIKSQGL